MRKIRIELDEEDVQSIWTVITKLKKSDDIHIRGLAATLKHRLFGK